MTKKESKKCNINKCHLHNKLVATITKRKELCKLVKLTHRRPNLKRKLNTLKGTISITILMLYSMKELRIK